MLAMGSDPNGYDKSIGLFSTLNNRLISATIYESRMIEYSR